MSLTTPRRTPKESAEIDAVLSRHPVIASVKDDDGLRAVLGAPCPVVFVLFGSVISIGGIVGTLKAAGKTVFVDVDLLDGFSSKPVVVDFLKASTQADGILSSKAAIVRAAKTAGLMAIHRLFLVDSFSYNNVPKQVGLSGADAIEILPGCMPRVISWLREDVDLPLIAGGLVCDKEDVIGALGAGAVAVASSNRGVWLM
ncbi:Glycerol-3-phosphate responsive antiterminator, GlpP [Sinomonas atrocyanea]|uniref:Glycerol-3-phosphate responsive antiterminator, GlpP n=1 Tax=Sinomonas atrocyanea TaxID=37927 RepID=A0A127A4K4_9MICC|nr:glycerol-3-phosphate responsive antiterminator [Sinomonas atrocyanea]AMM34418.1 Glycerol-3-phosphate responsive antiterminator, GlpP [Sinomonas atrocyanea]GEB65776.1 glycerol uptake operon antiterminator [Sinomonas atrocyanea]GGG60917.1 glycerol uptake operon antiterminator [Sinomonas atrocyanea]